MGASQVLYKSSYNNFTAAGCAPKTARHPITQAARETQRGCPQYITGLLWLQDCSLPKWSLVILLVPVHLADFHLDFGTEYMICSRDPELKTSLHCHLSDISYTDPTKVSAMITINMTALHHNTKLPNHLDLLSIREIPSASRSLYPSFRFPHKMQNIGPFYSFLKRKNKNTTCFFPLCPNMQQQPFALLQGS